MPIWRPSTPFNQPPWQPQPKRKQYAVGGAGVFPDLIATAEVVYSPTVSTAGTQTVNPNAIATAESVFAPTVSLTTVVSPNAIATAEIVRRPGVNPLRRVAPPGFLVGYAILGTGDGFPTDSVSALPDLVDYEDTSWREYNAAEPEDAFKFGECRPTQLTYNFAETDYDMGFVSAASQQMCAAGPLCWGNNIPSWLSGGSWTSSTLTAVMYDHIDTMVGRYAGQINSWEVVNEPLNTASIWNSVIGSTYIDLAFRRAHAADPSALLIINEYSCDEVNSLSNSYYSLVAGLVAGGTPIHGVGFQMHLTTAGLDWNSVATNFARFAALGLNIYITELDVRLTTPASGADLTAQAAVYSSAFRTALRQPACKGVFTWGFTDAHSWIPSVFAGTGEALPFDANYVAKAAYTAIHDALVFTLFPGTVATAESVYAPNVSLAGSTQTLNLSAIATAESVFAPAVKLQALLGTIASGEALYSPSVGIALVPAVIGTAEAVYSLTAVTQQVLPGALATGEAIYQPTVSAGAISGQVNPNQIPSAEVVYAPTVSQSAVQTVNPNVIASAEVVYGPAAVQLVQPGVIGTAAAVYQPVVALLTPQTVLPGAIATGAAVYGPTVAFRLPLVPTHHLTVGARRTAVTAAGTRRRTLTVREN